MSNTSDYENLETYFPFTNLRENQPDALAQLRAALLNPEVKIILLKGSTGSGKSAIGICAARASGSAYILTKTKNLQDQYLSDFEELVELKGRDNYICKASESKSCKSQENNCPYRENGPFCKKFYSIYLKASEGKIALFNFYSALAYLNQDENFNKFKKRKLLIADEAHNLIDALTDYNTFTVSKKWLEKNFPDFEDSFPQIHAYSKTEDFIPFLKSLYNYIKDKPTEEEKADIVEFIEGGTARIPKILKNQDNYVLCPNFYKETIVASFKPRKIEEHSQKDLFKHAEKTILMSATFTSIQTYCEVMGIDTSKIQAIDVPNVFPLENRPMYLGSAVGYVSSKTIGDMLPHMAKRIDDILSMYPDSKGIIHSVTYAIADYIAENLPVNGSRIIYPRSPRTQPSALQKHAQSLAPTILLSPSLDEGVDLKGYLSELQILAKTPYAYWGDPLLQERRGLYFKYYEMLTATTIIQATGRSIRTETDKADTFCIDTYTHQFIYENPDLFPEWFVKTIKLHPDWLLRDSAR